ncbi:MAG TPA: hypothetical protein PLN21_11105 [Gemmatales bacterium]|nr:hypothetical protein [Gemmatales bacterium]
MSRLLSSVTFGLLVSVCPAISLADDKPVVPPAQVPSLSELQGLGQIKAPTMEQARQLAYHYVAQLPQGKDRWAAIEPIWAPPDSRTLLDRTIDTFSQVEPNLAQYIAAVRLQASTLQLDTPLLKDAKYPAYVKNNLKLFLARALTNKRLHEEALAVLRSLTPETLVDPASYYFYRAVCENKLRLKDDGLVSTNRLLASMQQSAPERYLVVAGLMQDEMSKWEDQDLGDVARRMEEIEARLDNAHGGAKTQEKQKEVIGMLDKLIKEMEDQCQKCNCSGGGQAKSQAPAGESKIMNGAGPGEVENKKLIITAEVWGKMPEKEKVKALEAVNRQLPAHIREAAEGFSKKLQTGGK